MGHGTVINPPKETLDLGESSPYPPYKADINSMPEYVGWVDSAGIKWAGGWFENFSKRMSSRGQDAVLISPCS